jgi:hypothetical protein
LNAFLVLAAAYGLVGALSQVAGKVVLHRRVRKKGLLVNPNWATKWWIDKEASSDLIDIYTFILIGTSFIFAIFAEFSAYTDWVTATMSNVLVMAAVCVLTVSSSIMECEIGYAGHTWNSIWIEPKMAVFLPMFALLGDAIYVVMNRPVSDWVFAGLLIPQTVLVLLPSVLMWILPNTFQKRKLPPVTSVVT